ncbi:MAG: ATP-binding protein [Calothrix sp. MO_167.B42]|nr:ATP-binding protein [Calothrix sp. MO_167.B42]
MDNELNNQENHLYNLLNRNNALLKAQQDAALDGILVVDENRRVISYNQHFCELWQIPEDVLSESSSPQLLEYVLTQVAQPELFLAKVNYLYEHLDEVSRDEIYFQDGRIFDRYSSPIKSNTGEYYGRIWYFRDITERRRREEALRLIVEGTTTQVGSEFFCSCVRSLANILNMRYTLIAGFIDDCKDKVRTLAFWTGEEIGENFEYELAPTPCGELMNGEMRRYSNFIQSLFPQDPYLICFGAESYIGIPLIDKNGEIIGLIAALDTKPLPENTETEESILKIFAARTGAELERINLETALLKQLERNNLLNQITQEIRNSLDSQQIFQTTVNQVGKIFQVSRSHIHTYIHYPQPQVPVVAEYRLPDYPSMLDINIPIHGNPHAQKVLAQDTAYSLPDVYREPLWQPIIDIWKQIQLKSLLAIRTSYQGKVNGVLVLHQCDSIRYWTKDEIALLEAVAAQVGIALAQARNLEQEKENARLLQIAKNQAEAANCAKSTFIANISHELRTPLNAVLGFSELMQQNSTLNPQQQEYLQIINRSGKSLLNLINDVLEITKIEAGQTKLNLAPFDLHLLLQTLWSNFQPQAEVKHLSLQFDLPPNLPQYILGDESKLHQVLSNLLSNAIKFTGKGSIVFRVKIPQLADKQTHLNPIQLFFAVEDTGCGIAPEEIEQLFQPFVQTCCGYQAGNGTGLGLAISHEFVQLMGGNLEVNSTLGKGSIFYFCFTAQLPEFPQSFQPATQPTELDLSDNLQSETLTSQHLNIMSAAWIASLHQAAMEVDGDQIFRLIEQIPHQYQILVNKLTKLTRNYDFDAIIALTRGDENV